MVFPNLGAYRVNKLNIKSSPHIFMGTLLYWMDSSTSTHPFGRKTIITRDAMFIEADFVLNTNLSPSNQSPNAHNHNCNNRVSPRRATIIPPVNIDLAREGEVISESSGQRELGSPITHITGGPITQAWIVDLDIIWSASNKDSNTQPHVPTAQDQI